MANAETEDDDLSFIRNHNRIIVRKQSKQTILRKPVKEEFSGGSDVKTNNFFRDTLSPNNVNYPMNPGRPTYYKFINLVIILIVVEVVQAYLRSQHTQEKDK